MSKRVQIPLEAVADVHNLATAFHRAARGKRRQREVQNFESRLEKELSCLSREILTLTVPVGRMRTFEIHDPKRRMIHAPCFRERVLHHAVMAHVGPVLERSLVANTFACREGKGGLAAVKTVQGLMRRYSYFAKLDVHAYFAHIRHDVLRRQLLRRLQGRVLGLLDRIIGGHSTGPGRGLPIGALTSQHFANLYLGRLDRLLLETHRLGMVRYMDDVVILGQGRASVRAGARAAETFAWQQLGLEIKPGWQVAATAQGIPLCGYRIFPDRLLLSRRRMRRYRWARRRWEVAYQLGFVDARTLQAGYATALAITDHTESFAFRRIDLDRRRPVNA